MISVPMHRTSNASYCQKTVFYLLEPHPEEVFKAVGLFEASNALKKLKK